MKAFLYLGLCLISGLGFGCQVVFVSQNNSNQVLLASAMAKDLFFKSACAKVIDASSKSKSSEASQLMDEWNLTPTEVETLNIQDLESASLILTMTEEEKIHLQAKYPEYQAKIEDLSHCAGSNDKPIKNDLETFRQDVFQFEDIISTQKWQCLNIREL